jgi:hypothetical protein
MDVAGYLINSYIGLLETLRHTAFSAVPQLGAKEQRKNRASDNRKQHGSHQ